MGEGEGSVVDPSSMKVHGLEGLWVVDVSAMPYVTNGNFYAPVMTLAEEAADLIRGNTSLEPIDVQFFRHTQPESGHREACGPTGSAPDHAGSSLSR